MIKINGFEVERVQEKEDYLESKMITIDALREENAQLKDDLKTLRAVHCVMEVKHAQEKVRLHIRIARLEKVAAVINRAMGADNTSGVVDYSQDPPRGYMGLEITAEDWENMMQALAALNPGEGEGK